MPGLGNLHHRRGAAQQPIDIVADLGRHQHRMFAPENCHPAAGRLQKGRGVANGEMPPDGRIEFPGEAWRPIRPRYLFQGMARHPVQQEQVFARLGRHQPEARQRLGQRRIDVMGAGDALGVTLYLIAHWRVHRRIHDHDARQLLAIKIRRQHGDKAAKGMGHEHRWLGAIEHARIFRHRHFLAGEHFHGIILAPATVAHARQIHRRHIKVLGQIRRDEAPPIGMRGIAMHQQHARLGQVAPAQIMHPCAVDSHKAAFRFLGHGTGEPCRRGRGRAAQTRQQSGQRRQVEHVLFGIQPRNRRKSGRIRVI